MAAEILKNQCTDSEGHIWYEYYSEYPNDNYAPGGRDEVIQIKRGNQEMGHITWHRDANGRELSKNVHGSYHSLPC